MEKRLGIILFTLLAMLTLTGCFPSNSSQNIEKVGMLIEHSINDQTWGSKGYHGLLDIEKELDMEVYFKEGVQTQPQVNRAIEEFANQGVQLIIGHSSTYGQFFHTIASSYPDIQFVYVNGAYSDDNLISLNFNSMSMGFFAGMVAGKMTESDHVGIIAAYEWQPEVEGFYEGVAYQNPDANINIQYVYSWDESEIAMDHYRNMVDNGGVDVIYPTGGDAYSMKVVEEAQNDQIYSIGYVNDQQSIGGQSVLTSTIQHVDKLYLYAVEQIEKGELEGGIYNYGFTEEVISMGPYSDEIPEDFQDHLDEQLNEYIETGLLPDHE